MDTAQFQLHAAIEERHWWFTARRTILGRLVGHLHDHHQLRAADRSGEKPLLIDVGCGTGANLAAFAKTFRCLGVDTSPEAIQLAKQRYPHVEFRHGYAPDDLLDSLRMASVVTLNDVLEHVRDDFLLFSRIFAELSPGAICVLTVPADPAIWSGHDLSFGHYRRYVRERLEMLWQDLPIKAHLVSHFNARLYPLIRAVRTLNNWRGATGGVAGTDFKIPPAPLNHLLESCFHGESQRLLGALRGQRPGYSHGASLVAILERLPGKIQARAKPVTAGRDMADPELKPTLRIAEMSEAA